MVNDAGAHHLERTPSLKTMLDPRWLMFRTITSFESWCLDTAGELRARTVSMASTASESGNDTPVGARVREGYLDSPRKRTERHWPRAQPSSLKLADVNSHDSITEISNQLVNSWGSPPP